MGVGPWPGVEPRAPALRVQSLSHWTTREALSLGNFAVPTLLAKALVPVSVSGDPTVWYLLSCLDWGVLSLDTHEHGTNRLVEWRCQIRKARFCSSASQEHLTRESQLTVLPLETVSWFCFWDTTLLFSLLGLWPVLSVFASSSLLSS